jgi:hypothetical protein
MPELSASIDVLPLAFGQMLETDAHEDHGSPGGRG